jgi:hypothetical protein
VNTKLNVADMLTKPLKGEVFYRHRSKLMFGFEGREPNIDELDEDENQI